MSVMDIDTKGSPMEDDGPRIHHLGETTPWSAPSATDAGEPDVMEHEPTSKRTLATAAGLLIAGVVIGTIGVAAARSVSHTGPTTPTAAVGTPLGVDPQAVVPDGSAPQATVPQEHLGPNDGAYVPPGGFRGFDGEQHLQGTVTAIGAGSVTVQTSGGTATYVVNAATDIRRNGAPAQLSDLRAGDAVLVHVYPSGGASVAERVLVTTTGTGTARAT